MPKPLEFGHSLNVVSTSLSSSLLLVNTNINQGLKGAFIIIQSGGQIYNTISLNTDKTKSNIKINTSEIPNGIAQITLFNNKAEPVAERLVFLNDPIKKSQLEIKTDKSHYAKRDKINIGLNINHDNSVAAIGNLSCSIVKSEYGKTNRNIESYSLLQSEIDELLNYSKSFLDHNSLEMRNEVDLIMLTLGWRRFVWEEILKGKQKNLSYNIENGFTISGYTSKLTNNKNPVKSHVYLTSATPDGLIMRDVITDDDGRFEFTDLVINAESIVVIQANVYNKKQEKKREQKNRESKKLEFSSKGNRNLKIHISSEKIPLIIKSEHKQKYHVENVNTYADNQISSNKLDSIYSSSLHVEMDNLVIKGRRSNHNGTDSRGNNPIYNNPTNRVILDSISGFQRFNSVFEVLRRISGVTILGTAPNQKAMIRGASSITLTNEATYYLNGIEITGETVSDILMDQVSSIDVFKGADAAVFGSRGANGVISINTKAGNQSSTREQTGIYKFRHSGYYKAREFHSPDYGKKLPDHQKPDYRTTLYWNPNIITNAKGKAHLEFYANDIDGNYLIRIEGLDPNEVPLYNQKILTINP